MNWIIVEIILVACLIVINGLFSMTEIAVVSARRMRLKQAADAGNQGAAAALALQAKPDRFLSAVQIGITLVGILSGAFGGAALSQSLGSLIAQIPALAPYAQAISFTIIILVITYFSLVVGELVPKNLALNYPEKIAVIFARPMNLVSRITAPFVSLLSGSTNLILKIFRVSEKAEAGITEEEIKAHIAQGTQLGVLDATEQELIESVIRLDDQRLPALMTPRLKISWLNLDDDAETTRAKIINAQYSRLPVGNGNLDDIAGFVKAKDLLVSVLRGENLDLRKVLKQPLFVPETKTALEMLELFRDGGTSLAVVINEFGATEGLVTMNDVLQAIVGDLPTAGGVRHQSIVRRDDGSFLLDGSLSVPDFKDLLSLKNIPADERDAYQTLAGFVLARLEKLPAEGEKFAWEDYVFEIMDMDGRRVDKVLVTAKNADL